MSSKEDKIIAKHIKSLEKKVDIFTYTSAVSGIKEDVKWELFDVGLIKSEVRQSIANHYTMNKAFTKMPYGRYQFQFWYEFMYASEKMIANWQGLDEKSDEGLRSLHAGRREFESLIAH
jgi:hypothetical protein